MGVRHVPVGLAALALVAAGAGPAAAAPGGSPSSYRTQSTYDSNLGREVVVRWNPCKAVRVKVNAGPYGQAGVAEVKKAVVLAGQASGLSFTYAGTTTWFPRGAFPADQRQKTGADLVVGFADARRTSFFARADGRAHVHTEGTSDEATRIEHAAAFVAVSPRLSPGFGRGETRGKVLLHEVGHALGLDHVSDRSQIMVQGSGPATAEYQRGDLAGLRKVGRPAGCIVSRVRDTDRDDDGVPDDRDRDPDDARNPSTTDTDGDGTVDRQDLYPQDPYADGMGLEYDDSDGDGIDNREDPAPGDPAVPGRSATATATTSDP